MSETTTSINQTPCILRTVQYSLPVETCDRCGQLAPKYSSAHRTAIDLDMAQPVLLDVQVSIHHCRPCRHYFRAQPPFLRRDGIYTERVIQKTVDAVFKDSMAYRRVTERMERDFWVQPCEGSIRRWCRIYSAGFHFETDYQAWVVAEFSSILCVDEVYQNELALLLAVDPAASDGDRLVGYQLVHGSVNADDVQDFIIRLKAAGIQPEQVVTDGSSLYPAVLKEVWPKAAHQLCLFHETRHITRAAMKAINAIRKQMPVVRSANDVKWHIGGPITDVPPASEPESPAWRRWYWRRLQRHHRINHIHQLGEQGLSLRAMARQTGHHRRTIRGWLQQPIPPLPDNMPADIAEAEIVWPEKQQRLIDNQRRLQLVHQLAAQGHNHSAIGRMVNIHRVTIKKWLQQPLLSTETEKVDSDNFKEPIPEGWESVEEVTRIRELLRQHRFLLIRRLDRLSEEEKEVVDELLTSSIGNQLQIAHAFVQDWYRIWWEGDGIRKTPDSAKNEYLQWRQNPDFKTFPVLKRVIAQVTDGRFEKISHFLKHAQWEATNNGAERMGRSFRHRQAPHYNLRRSETIEKAIVVDAFLRKERATNTQNGRFHHCQRGRTAQL